MYGSKRPMANETLEELVSISQQLEATNVNYKTVSNEIMKRLSDTEQRLQSRIDVLIGKSGGDSKDRIIELERQVANLKEEKSEIRFVPVTSGNDEEVVKLRERLYEMEVVLNTKNWELEKKNKDIKVLETQGGLKKLRDELDETRATLKDKNLELEEKCKEIQRLRTLLLR